MITKITYYDPRQKRQHTIEMKDPEDWRVQAMVVKLRREGKVIRDVRAQGTGAAVRNRGDGFIPDIDRLCVLEDDNGPRGEDEVHTATCEPD